MKTAQEVWRFYRMFEKDRSDGARDTAPGAEGEESGLTQPAIEATDTLKQNLETERQRAETNLAGWQRAAADLANYRKRTEQERLELVKFANADLLRRLLPVLDDLDRAFQNAPQDVAWAEGIKLIDRKLRSIMEQEGLAPYDSVGQPFDPAYHDAISYEESDPQHAGLVIGELQRGYKLGDRVLRPALVRVGRGRTS